ncbi:MAG: hypothetical protein ACREXY_24035, partial [Gammaproteobacteria bacterium]
RNGHTACCPRRTSAKSSPASLGVEAMMRNARTRILVVLAIPLAACHEPERLVLGPPPEAELRSAISASLATSLDPRGQFPHPVQSSRQTIGPARAIELAEAWRNTFAMNLVSAMEKDHGAPIDLQALTHDPRVLLAESPYDIDASSPKPMRKAFSDYFLVNYKSGNGAIILSIAVSAIADDLEIVNGRLRFPKYFGNEFFMLAAPRDRPEGLPFSPERAAVIAHERFSGIVTNVPRLLIRGISPPSRARGAPQYAIWSVPLQEQKNAGRAVEVYLGPFGRTLVPTLVQPDSQTVGAAEPNGSTVVVTLRRRSGTPVQFSQ